MRRTALCVLVLGLAWPVSLLFTGAALPTEDRRVLLVSTDGPGHYRSIQAAVDEARRGDVIRIAAGHYAEDVTIHSKEHLSLIGDGPDKVTILGLNRVGSFHIGKWPYGASHIDISGVTIQEHGGLALGIFNGQAIVLHHVKVKGLVFGQQVQGVRLEQCSIGGSETTGVQFADSQATLVANTISGNDHGVTVAGKSDVRLERNLITGNLYEGVLVTDSARAVLVSNTIVKNGGGVAFLNTSRGEASGNVIGLNGIGFLVAPTSTARLSYNAVSNVSYNYGEPGPPPRPAAYLKPDSDVTVEPEFMDPSQGDFRLRSTSPLVGIGEFPFLGALPPVESRR